MKPLLTVLSFCLVAASCSDPVAPTPRTPDATPPPQPAPLYPLESWALTSTFSSMTPNPCWRDLTGLTYEYKLVVRREEPMRLIVWWDPTDGIEYVGSPSGQDFALAGTFNQGNSFGIGCASSPEGIGVILTGRVSGRFSDDGRSISAEEVLSYLVVRTGEQIDVRYRWAATAPVE